MLRERVHDPYRAGEKLRGRAFCPDCGVQYRNGRWVWSTAGTAGLRSQPCPACRRINDDYPAGEALLAGTFVQAHRKEILATVRNVEEAEQSEHPLNRIISVTEDDSSITITTTDIHLPHRIVHALRDAWGGSMSTHYDVEGYFTRVRWERES
jgi:hypothetical protein